MPDKRQQSDSNDSYTQKEKQIRYSDDKPQETGDNIPILSPLVPSQKELNAEDLSIIYMIIGRSDEASVKEFIKEQHECLSVKQTLHQVHKSETGQSSKSKALTDPNGTSKIFDVISDSDSDEEYDHSKDAKELIFELEITNTSHLSIPYQMASTYFPPLAGNPDQETTFQLVDQHDRIWGMTLSYDSQENAYIISHGWDFYIDCYGIKPLDLVRIYKLNHTQFYVEHETLSEISRPLFTMLVPRSNRLAIPYELAIEHFRVKSSANLQQADHLEEYTLHLTDFLEFTWEMRFVCFAEEGAFVIVRGWDHYVDRHDLLPNDTIKFFMQNSTSCRNSFIIHNKPRLELDPPSPEYFAPPLFMQQNLMCELHLSHIDVVYGSLEIRGFEIPFRHQTQEMVKFTDEKDRSWYMIIEKSKVTNVYNIIDGWEGFVKAYQLEAQDMVRIYMPIMAEHGMHFLIECVKKEKIEKEDGGSDPGQPSDAAGPSQGGGSLKGKEIVEG